MNDAKEVLSQIEATSDRKLHLCYKENVQFVLYSRKSRDLTYKKTCTKPRIFPSNRVTMIMFFLPYFIEIKKYCSPLEQTLCSKQRPCSNNLHVIFARIARLHLWRITPSHMACNALSHESSSNAESQTFSHRDYIRIAHPFQVQGFTSYFLLECETSPWA